MRTIYNLELYAIKGFQSLRIILLRQRFDLLERHRRVNLRLGFIPALLVQHAYQLGHPFRTNLPNVDARVNHQWPHADEDRGRNDLGFNLAITG
jgi:hypothetical protein